MMRDLRTTLLSPGCFLAALHADQVASAEGASSPVLPQHGPSTPHVEALCSAAPQPFLALDSAGTPVPIAPHGIISKILQEDGSREEEGVPWLQRSAFWWCLL